MMFVRPAVIDDLPALAEAAQHLDSVNLPNDQDKLREAILRSQRSFSHVAQAAPAGGAGSAAGGAGTPGPEDGEFLFVMVERQGEHERAVGSSMIFARHGSRRAPHSYFDVIEDERYSETLDRHFRHKVLRIGYNYDGMTELGGLVLLPQFRGHPERLGKTLVFVRFLFIALYRSHFRDLLVSELMPPLQPDGTSLLWEALGRHFTGLSYQDADRLSRANKEFIRALFPQDPIYTTLLPAAAQAQIGLVGPNTRAVERMLTEAGFRYAQRIDPFDGGPHFHAHTDELLPVKRAQRAVVSTTMANEPATFTGPALVAATSAAPPHFVAVRTAVSLAGEKVLLSAEAARTLGAAAGGVVGVLPL